MQEKTITYKRINNLGNYNSEHLEIIAVLDEGEDPIIATQQLKAKVETALGLNKTPVEKPKTDNDVPW